MKKIITTTSKDFHEKTMLYYAVFFSLFFAVFSIVLLISRTYILGILFLSLSLQVSPLKKWRENIPDRIASVMLLLNVVGIFLAFREIAR